QIEGKLGEYRALFKRKGNGSEWIVAEIPEKDVVFTVGYEKLMRTRKAENLYLERDPVKIVLSNGKPALLVEYENSLMQDLSTYINFAPNVYANEPALKLIGTR